MTHLLARVRAVVAVAVAGLVCAPMAVAQFGEWGDAPEGVLAYPSLGTFGNFPTCMNVPINAFILHGPTPPLWAFFGPNEDYEGEGNGGQCPMFPPYDSDECFQDGDAGLLFPGAWTIQGGVEVPCVFPDTLAADCTMAIWGVDIDIRVVNNGPWTGYVNVIADWNQDGWWGGASQCPTGAAPEHVLINWPVPAPYNGPLSGVLPPGSGFLVGPNLGYVWVRFSIMETPVLLPWQGDGIFEGGESEDYLLLVERGGGEEEAEYGDAPEGATAYPNGVMGAFPTCVTVGPAGYVYHRAIVFPRLAFFGPMSDDETDGNAGACPVFAPYDLDECFQDGDAGLIMPAAYTLQATAVPIPCNAPPGSLLVCQQANWGVDIDIDVTNNMLTDAYVNVLADWTVDGQWSGSILCPGGPAPEHVLVDWPVPPGFSGPLSMLGPPPFLVGPIRDYVWTRFTVGEAPVGPDWNGDAVFEEGETEDYLLRTSDPFVSVESIASVPSAFRLYESAPNPVSRGTTIRFDLPAASPVSLRIYDVAGRLLRTLVQESRMAGQHSVVWNGRNDVGRQVGSGTYFYRLDAGSFHATRRVVLLR